MKKCLLPWVLSLVFALLSAGMAYKFIYYGSTLKMGDQRLAIVLTPTEKDLVLSEMRAFLSSVQQITQGISTQDVAQVARAARIAGQDAARGVPTTLMGKLPLEFKMLGMRTHAAFDELALNVEQLEDTGVALEMLSDLLNNCVACHATYRFIGEEEKDE